MSLERAAVVILSELQIYFGSSSFKVPKEFLGGFLSVFQEFLLINVLLSKWSKQNYRIFLVVIYV